MGLRHPESGNMFSIPVTRSILGIMKDVSVEIYYILSLNGELKKPKV